MKRDQYLRTADPVRLSARCAVKRALDPRDLFNRGS
jgi:hypothetical protein